MSGWIKNVVDKIKDLSVSVDSYKKDSIIQSLPVIAIVNKAKKLIDKKMYDEAEKVLKRGLDIADDALLYKYLAKSMKPNINFRKLSSIMIVLQK